MKRVLIALALAVAFLAGSPMPGGAEDYSRGVIYTKNGTEYQAWITVYNFARQQMGSGWLNPRVLDSWNRCCYSAGSKYYVRAEVKGWRNGERVNIFDTTIEVVPRMCAAPNSPPGQAKPMAYARVVLRQGRGETFYWDRDDRTPNGNCDRGM